MTRTMKALVLTVADGPTSARVEQVAVPEPGAGEVRIALRAASLNHRELWISRGQYPGMRLPCILGADGAGIIDAVGLGIDRNQVGREVVLYPGRDWGDNKAYPSKQFSVLGMPTAGTIAEYVCVPAAHAFAKPASLSFEEAACLPTGGVTAWRALVTKAQIRRGEKVLVTGIGGGVATLALRLAAAMGAIVYVTSGSTEKLTIGESLGASGGVCYRQDKWGKALQALSGGIDVVIDGAPGSSFGQYVRALNFGARVLIYGSTGGTAVEFSAPDLFLRHASVIGTAMGTTDDFRNMLAFVEAQEVKPVIDRAFPLEQAGEALHYLEAGHQIGKVTIRI
ncbi:alcohol dehydrogenase [Paraburkholderia caffeinilytica]|uniref:Zinc-type alcohol dehydrogenase-like protein YogA n=1 Tax=Paraburkholderia caffeinilytica TaxID=1761016 RepID=A0ABQ1LN41_9BURK|nr:zinc-binding dehydrogenase [Paraburkholderia caffeinilytica]AXL53671.1 alcohol dehydrogenase [Paraburkholderia caffeinilytica]GGC27066.1 putative zinc-type alcohol dehydrogenase-like protein YogA [Paraburkholderia caffeinilytica]CAB3780040.1 Alcohol dehydrogenase [Paraburkholderia caffeinilytica]